MGFFRLRRQKYTLHISLEAHSLHIILSKAFEPMVMETIPEVKIITIRNFARTTGVAFRALGDPKQVPRDQNFGLKNFLMPSSNDVILCVSEVCWSKNAEN